MSFSDSNWIVLFGCCSCLRIVTFQHSSCYSEVMAMARSLIPSMFGRNWWDTWDYPSNLFDQHFGTGLSESDLYPPTLYRGYILRHRTRASEQLSGQSKVKNEKDKFQVTLNVSHFKPEELEVKVLDNCIVIHGKHEEKSDDHGFVQREFTRRYMLPDGAESEAVASSLSSNGILTIEAPKKTIEPPVSEGRVIPVAVQKPGIIEEK